MSLDWLDHRTLLVCNVLVATLFCVLFLGVRWTYPRMRGATEAAIAFLVCIPGATLMATQTTTTHRFIIVCADSSIPLFFFLSYLAIVRFLAVPLSRWSWVFTFAPIASIAFFSYDHDSVIGRMASVGLSVALLRLLTGVTLFRYPIKRRLMTAFAAFMLISSVIAFRNSYVTAVYTHPNEFYPGGHTASNTLLFAIIGFSLTGVFFLGLFGDELTEIVGRRAEVDPLTGVLNRQGIDLRFTAELERATRTHRPLSILLMDIDHFKQINDTQGHLAGDQALSQITQTVLSAIRAYDILGRFGGDEFLVLLPETGPARALEIAERIRSNLKQQQSHSITLSIGIAQAVPHDQLHTLVDRVDAALYQAKRDGRNCVRVYQPAATISNEASGPYTTPATS